MCISYAVEPREFVELYMPFMVSNLKQDEDATDSTLDNFERKILANYKSNASNTSEVQRNHNDYEIGSDDDDDAVMGAYICTTPKVGDLLTFHLNRS